ncbi:MAG: hypothetical protein LUC30_05695 [Clostridiales bacterium]|nr:hypothetical protein [Clostridiales bacterium]
MYYHASPVDHIVELEPRISNHGIPLIYFSRKRENVLVYLSNAVEKYCKDMGFSYDGKWHKWASYGFDQDGRQRITEYYPDALESTYKGVSGYIYSAEKVIDSRFQHRIPDAVTSSQPVKVTGIEFVPDAYEAILHAEREHLITITRYYELSDKMKNWIKNTIMQEYEDASECPDYRYFLHGVFPDILSDYHCS